MISRLSNSDLEKFIFSQVGIPMSVIGYRLLKFSSSWAKCSPNNSSSDPQMQTECCVLSRYDCNCSAEKSEGRSTYFIVRGTAAVVFEISLKLFLIWSSCVPCLRKKMIL